MGISFRCNLRDGTLVCPSLELKVLQGDIVVLGLDIVGEDLAVGHVGALVSSGVSRARTGRSLREETKVGLSCELACCLSSKAIYLE